MDSNLISSIYKTRKILLDLMKRQKYDTSEYDNFSINEVNAKFVNNQLDMLLEKENENKEHTKLYIRYFITGKTLRLSDIQNIIDDLFHLSETLTTKDTLTIIVKEPMNEILMNDLKHIWEQDHIFIIVQSLSSLQFNILDNVLVPPHRVLSTSEVEEVKKKYNITEDTQFGDISRYDPVAMVIGIRPNMICEILRPSKTAIQTKYYRMCI